MAGKTNKRGAGTPTRRDALSAATRAAHALPIDYLSLLEVPCPLGVTSCPGKNCEHCDEDCQLLTGRLRLVEGTA